MRWCDIDRVMAEARSQYDNQVVAALDVLPCLLKATNKIVSFPSEMTGDRPHQYLASVWQVQTFRHTLSGISTALTGYPDAVSNLQRTVMETSVRLLYMKKDPVAVALAMLIGSRRRLIAVLRSEVDYRKAEGIDLMNFERNLEGLRKQVSALENAANKRGLDVNAIMRRYDKKTFWDICKDKDVCLTKWYKVSFGALSLAVHGNELDFDRTVFSKGDSTYVELGPIVDGERECAVLDSLLSLSMHTYSAARLLEYEDVLEVSWSTSKKLLSVAMRFG